MTRARDERCFVSTTTRPPDAYGARASSLVARTAPMDPHGAWILRGPDERSRPPGAVPPRLRLFCLPQAGAGAWCFHGWSARLPPDVEVLPVELPGRNSRASEPADAHPTLQRLASAVLDGVRHLLPGGELPGQPPNPPHYALFGHSLGAWLAYEITCEVLRRRRELGDAIPMPTKLYLSGNRAPRLAGPDRDPDRENPTLAKLPESRFWPAFERRYGANPALRSPEMRARILPILRADFHLAETYRPTNLGRFAFRVPAVAVGAVGDERTTDEGLAAWARHFAPPCEDAGVRFFDVRWVRGVSPEWERRGEAYWGTPHRIVLDYPDELLAFMNDDLRGLTP